jgi:putative membrane protein
VLSGLLATAAGRPGGLQWRTWDVAGLVPVALTALLYGRGWSARRRRNRPVRRGRALAFGLGLAAVAAAFASPLHAWSDELASAHMVQHLLVVVVAAPLLALSRPVAVLAEGLPAPLAVTGTQLWRAGPLRRSSRRLVRAPVWMALAHAATLWAWHASVPYDLAVRHTAVHLASHASFLLTGLGLWAAVGACRRAHQEGLAVLVLFGVAMQGALLSALLTFAPEPWYDAYRSTTGAWGMTPLGDQQLAGAIMWVPGGSVYVAAAIALVVAWVRDAPSDVGAERPVSRSSALS